MRRVPVVLIVVAIVYLALVGGFTAARNLELAEHPAIEYYPSLAEAFRAFRENFAKV